ncbi:MAG: RsmB/NOP family class I SAM-dependent RNA methyltransferase [Hyphomicrobiales bacterium]|nr:MAG: RsmB/NOP family class I SAM-dependent RNA methyltransferase [Hyphomicrobiales bacterium]
MRPAAQIRSAFDVFTEIKERHRPAAVALADWGKAHRFAGSGDRAAIGNLVYDALRRVRSLSAQMQSDTPRAIVLAAAPRALGIGIDAIVAGADGTAHALTPLSEEEKAGLARTLPADTPADILGDYPEWLGASFARAFGNDAAAEGAALAARAPVDLRVNTLKADRDKVIKALEKFGAHATTHSPLGVRLPAPEGRARQANVEAETAHGRGWYEVQDEGSQIAALMAGAFAREQVLDLCAGAGGKALAFAAAMQNTGQIFAYDDDRMRLRPIFERLKRAGARNVQVLDAADSKGLAALGARFDLVFVDAPCTGTGSWRRRPDAKWRLKPAALEQRQAEQDALLTQAASHVKPGGRLVYVTCSVLPEENGDRIEAFLAREPQFEAMPWAPIWEKQLASPPVISANGSDTSLLLTPRQHDTDGFFVCVMRRR